MALFEFHFIVASVDGCVQMMDGSRPDSPVNLADLAEEYGNNCYECAHVTPLPDLARGTILLTFQRRYDD